ncbi:transcriptional repressor LexA [Novilysobacter defluvii]|uniref:LexA repressor n=1 Tax=Lysobacter defluvii IMMIB APB-9 = DSM 18482 TaxID=1385515 RepID=A0A0A0MA69_9GAMM|nr:transcriptional repressor LexA [Lysobacter defluvii]KGO98036.1 LexA family transcriptional regulator [Lysobacter defluvii IMMIB APB-9 = DSM 18482]
MHLTDTQRRLLDYLRGHIARHGYPPSQMEIARAFGFRQNRSARYHLDALRDAGLVELADGRARGIRLTTAGAAAASVADGVLPAGPGDPDGLLQVPLFGRVAAGTPIGSDPEVRREVQLDPTLFRLRPDYLLEVEGESMLLDGILPGDLIGVHRTPQARNGQTVVARVEGELTVKRLDHGPGHLRLLPRNPAHAPIEIGPTVADFAIEGLFAGLVRPS